MAPIPPGWWLVGNGTLPIARTLSTHATVVVAIVVALAAALALRSALRASRER